MRLSRIIAAIENGTVRAAKATGRQAQRINHAMSVELAANRLADGEFERQRLAARPAIEAFEVQTRAEELLDKRSSAVLVRELHRLRRELGNRVMEGASVAEIDRRAMEIERLTHAARTATALEAQAAHAS